MGMSMNLTYSPNDEQTNKQDLGLKSQRGCRFIETFHKTFHFIIPVHFISFNMAYSHYSLFLITFLCTWHI